MKSRTNSSRRSTTWTADAPVRSAFSRIGTSSSPWPRSAQKATTSQPYRSISQRRITEVSSPPEYARTTRFGLDVIDRATEQAQHHGLLRVQPVLGLLAHDGPPAVEHPVGNLLAPPPPPPVHHDPPLLAPPHPTPL